jgi:four helix bundle protein
MKNKIYNLKERAYMYALDIIKFLEILPREYVSQTIGRQLLCSATSIGANIIEAQVSSSKKDFANFYRHSLKSANESKFWLALLKDSNKAPADRVGPVLTETNEIANILAASILTIKRNHRF